MINRFIVVAASGVVGLSMAVGCKSAPQTNAAAAVPVAKQSYPARPSGAVPSFKLVHRDNDTFTLATSEAASDDQIAALLWQFHDAARAHTFDALHLSQTFIDARQPKVWFHVYSGAKCASEKYVKGPLPCDASYHGVGDYMLGSYANRDWDEAVVHHPGGTETRLWDSDAAAGSK